MRISYVTMSFPAKSETFATNDVRLLRESGAQVTVHSLRAAAHEAAELLTERGLAGVSVTYNTGVRSFARGLLVAIEEPRAAVSMFSAVVRTCISAPMHLARSLILFPRVLEIYGVLRRDQPDVVHAYWAHYPSLVLHLVQHFMPRVVTSISFSAYDIRHRYPMTGRVTRDADVVRSLSKATARETSQAFGIPADRIEVIHDSVDLRLVPERTQRTPRRVVSVGRLVRRKGMEDVLRTFAAVHRRFPDATLRILGTGPELPRLIRMAAELGIGSAVTFLGHRSQTDVLTEMRQAEVFVFLSVDERLPNVVKEAMACECVCVVSRTIGICELVDHGVSGFIVEQGDTTAVIDHVTATFEGRVPTDVMTERAAAWIRGAFDLRVNARRYLELWHEHVERRRALFTDTPAG